MHWLFQTRAPKCGRQFVVSHGFSVNMQTRSRGKGKRFGAGDWYSSSRDFR